MVVTGDESCAAGVFCTVACLPTGALGVTLSLEHLLWHVT